MNAKELCCIREWAPMTEIVERIPARIQKGLFPMDLNITCIDAVPEFLALGTDPGIVFWYNRFNGEVQKLRAETTTRVTCVKIVNSVEFMVAAGNANGQVSIFQIQKELPPDLNLVAPCTRAKPIERYTIRDLHHSAISCCEWSKNGMKLYSGDRQGVIVLTEVDYQLHLTKSAEILSEAYEIVQLSVHKGFLLVSTLYRSIVCHQKQASNDWHITQVGKKDRKQLVDCGGTFLKCSTTKLPLMVCGRPGLRFWIADIEGNVEKTLLFKEAVVRSPTWEIPILNPKITSIPATQDAIATAVVTANFCTIHLYAGSNSLMVTHDDNANLYVLNMDNLRVEAVARGFRKIIDICVCGKEIFILEGERSLLRLAPMPEKPNKTAKIIFNPLMPPPLPLLGASIAGAFESPVEYEPEEEAVINAEECFELPPIEEINSNILIELAVESPLAEQNRRLEIFQQISEMDFDSSILHHSGISSNSRNERKKHKSRERKKSGGIIEIGHAAAGAVLQETVKFNKEKPNLLEFTTNQPTIMDASFCASKSSLSRGSFSDHMPDVLSPNTLKKTIEMKAKRLAEDLDIPPVHLQPITAEELEQSKALTAAPPTVSLQSPPQSIELQLSKSVASWQLPLTYPQHSTQVEDAGVQTTPRKKHYCMQDECDFSAGQPIDEICRALIATNIREQDKCDGLAALCENQAISRDEQKEKRPLQFVPSHPVVEEIDSFLLDFRRAPDPLHTSPAASGDSNTSSEWEFLDN